MDTRLLSHPLDGETCLRQNGGIRAGRRGNLLLAMMEDIDIAGEAGTTAVQWR
jgi:hypothetical protein